MFETFMYEFFGALLRQGPGDRESTRKAFRMVEGLPPKPEILDLGCGTGKQTLDLASLTPGRITAVDNHGPFLERLRENVLKRDLSAEVRPVLGDMIRWKFPPGSFDLIWCKAVAYIIGFRRALEDWRPLLRKGGSMVVSELVWRRKDQPNDSDRSEFSQSLEAELDMHRKYREYYGYMFYIMRKKD